MIDLSGRLASGDTLYGTFLGLGSALAAEACALAGFDWLLTDLEHGGGDESELLPQQLAADAHGVPMLVRVESTHRIRAGHALDLGAAGVMFPGIESADQATQAMRHLRYPPDGDRGVATYNRAYGFGLHPERLATANERVLGDRADREQARRGTGRRDRKGARYPRPVHRPPRPLARSRRARRHECPGIPGRVEARAGRRRGCRPRRRDPRPDAETARRYADRGLRFIGIGSDATLLALAGRHAVDCVRAGAPDLCHGIP